MTFMRNQRQSSTSLASSATTPKHTMKVKNWLLVPLVVSIIAISVARTGVAAEPVSTESLLREMVDRERLARYPQVDFRLKQDSSYDRSSISPDDEKGWFANYDRSTNDNQANFIRTEQNQGRKEWVVMEDEGPGSIVRFWVPWRNQLKPGTDIIIRFYLDGKSEPAIEGNMFELFQGKGLVPFPLAHESLRSAVSFFPIPYAKGCKVTMSDHPFFFQFTYREYDDGTEVSTFSMDDFQAAKPLISTTCDSLLNPSQTAQDDDVLMNESIAGGQETSVSLPDGIAAVRKLSVKLGTYKDPNVTRNVVLKMSFDDKQTVWCPIGDFFGSGIGLNPFKGWYRDVDADGTMTSRWVMPYQENATVSIVNLGDEPVDVQFSATIGDWQWDSSSMYFHAGWRGQYPVPTRPYSDWNYVTLQGRGVYVGDTLTIMNPVERWWGEGDEKIFVDGESFPSLFGTGTEDYYAYSWGGRSTDFYEHPFHAQTFSHTYNKLNRKPDIDEKNTQGFSTETRTRALDTMPFATSLQLDMEVWSWTDCEMGYGVGVYWYGDAETTSNHEPDPKGATAVPPLPRMNGSLSSTAGPNVDSFDGAMECETMKILAKPDAAVVRPQNLKRFRGNWSAASHLFVKGTKAGDAIELVFPSKDSSSSKLVLHATKSDDYGVLRLSVNGKSIDGDVDLYAEKPIPSGPIELGTFEPVNDEFRLRAKVVGKHPQSKETYFGLDCVELNGDWKTN